MNTGLTENNTLNRKVCAAIVTYNRLDFLKDAIKSLQSQTYPCDIVVINNGSTDGTSKFLNSQRGLQVIQQENVGGAGGFYTGLKFISENGYDIAWIMDDDIIADKNCLMNMMERYNELIVNQNSIGFLCSRVINTNGEPVNTPKIDYSPNSTGYPDWNNFLQDGLVKVSSATFVSVLIPTNNIYEVGLPIKEFFIWGDDTEYTSRLSHKYPSYQVGNSIIKHLRYGGTLSIFTMDDKNRIRMYQNFVRNHMYLSKHKYPNTDSFLVRCVKNLCIIFRLIFTLKFTKAKYYTIGFIKGLFFYPQIKFPSNQGPQTTNYRRE